VGDFGEGRSAGWRVVLAPVTRQTAAEGITVPKKVAAVVAEFPAEISSIAGEQLRAGDQRARRSRPPRSLGRDGHAIQLQLQKHLTKVRVGLRRITLVILWRRKWSVPAHQYCSLTIDRPMISTLTL